MVTHSPKAPVRRPKAEGRVRRFRLSLVLRVFRGSFLSRGPLFLCITTLSQDPEGAGARVLPKGPGGWRTMCTRFVMPLLSITGARTYHARPVGTDGEVAGSRALGPRTRRASALKMVLTHANAHFTIPDRSGHGGDASSSLGVGP